MDNIFENAYFGKAYLCRNNTIAYYSRCDRDGKHWLMVNDDENDFISCNEDGHNFDPEELKKVIPEGRNKGKTICELYGWNYEEMVNHRLDIVSEYQVEISEEEQDNMAQDFYDKEIFEYAEDIKDPYIKCYKAGLHKGLGYINKTWKKM